MIQALNPALHADRGRRPCDEQQVAPAAFRQDAQPLVEPPAGPVFCGLRHHLVVAAQREDQPLELVAIRHTPPVLAGLSYRTGSVISTPDLKSV